MSKRAAKSPTMISLIEAGFEYLEGFCLKCGRWQTMHFDSLPVVSGASIDFNGLTLARLAPLLRCKKCNGGLEKVAPWKK